jgi:hypothetical protein
MPSRWVQWMVPNPEELHSSWDEFRRETLVGTRERDWAFGQLRDTEFRLGVLFWTPLDDTGRVAKLRRIHARRCLGIAGADDDVWPLGESNRVEWHRREDQARATPSPFRDSDYTRRQWCEDSYLLDGRLARLLHRRT